MGEKIRILKLLSFYCCYFLIPFIFQTVGLFTPKWASTETCDSIGLMYSCCKKGDNETCEDSHGGDELDERALGLHSTSFSLMVLAALFLFSGTLCYVRRNKNYDEEDDCCAELWGEFINAILLAMVHGIALLSFSISGLFSVIGCIIVATKFSASELGYSFYLCLTAGCLIILGTIFACIMFCKFVVIKKKSNDETIRRSGTMSQSGGNGRSRSRGGASSVNSYTESGGVAPYEPRQAHVKYEAQHATAHQSVFIDDDEYEGIVDVLLAGGIIALFTLAIAGAVKDR